MHKVHKIWPYAYSKRQKALAFQGSACLSKTHEMALKDPFQRRLIDFTKFHLLPQRSVEPATIGFKPRALTAVPTEERSIHML